MEAHKSCAETAARLLKEEMENCVAKGLRVLFEVQIIRTFFILGEAYRYEHAYSGHRRRHHKARHDKGLSAFEIGKSVRTFSSMAVPTAARPALSKT